MEDPKFYGEYRKQLKAAQIALVVKSCPQKDDERVNEDER